MCLAKLHNFCIDQKESILLAGTYTDQLNIESQEGGHIALVQRDTTRNQSVPAQLIGAGHHFHDVVRRDRRQIDTDLPRDRLLAVVEDAGLSRPVVPLRRH